MPKLRCETAKFLRVEMFELVSLADDYHLPFLSNGRI